ncbi:MAG: AAA family ATPase [Segetibacter sp.]
MALSTGTLRIVALLAVFRHPQPAPVVVIEELENGLDPRTIHLIISEIRNFIENTGSQVIFTTHSPYLLDLLNLNEIVFVEKTDSDVKFSKPGDNKEITEWAEKFTLGKLYTMSRLNKRS